MNAQPSPMLGVSPHELFLGRPPWKLELLLEPNMNPQVHTWLSQQILLQEHASLRLQKLRSSTLLRANKNCVPSPYATNDYVLVHNKRWPQRKWPKLSPQWQGPFKVLKASFNSLQVKASPSLGGEIEVSTSMCKKMASWCL